VTWSGPVAPAWLGGRFRRGGIPTVFLFGLVVSCSPDGELAEPPPVLAPAGTDIWIAPLEGEGTDDLRIGEPRNATHRPDHYDNQPFFLPSADQLLYTAADEDGRTDVHRLELPDGASTRVTRTPTTSQYSPTPLAHGGISVIQVEEDGTQRLWRFGDEGSGPELLLPQVAPVGYQAWLDESRVAVFVLGEPPTLQVADLESGHVEEVFSGIGPSLQVIPGRVAVSFVEVRGDTSWIREYDGATGESRRLIRTEDGGSHHAWTPTGVLLMAHGERILAWAREEEQWTEVGRPGPDGIRWSRLAVSPDGRWIALVGEETTRP
jgi:hypothetical protein